MALPNTDPSLPSNPSPIFGDIDAARGDQMRANNNLIWGNLTNLDTREARIENLLATVTSSGILTLTSSSARNQLFTGTLPHTAVLPVVSTLHLGFDFLFMNNSSGSITINSSGSNLVKTLLPGKSIAIVCIAITGTTASSWTLVDVDALTLNGHADSYFALASNFTSNSANSAIIQNSNYSITGDAKTIMLSAMSGVIGTKEFSFLGSGVTSCPTATTVWDMIATQGSAGTIVVIATHGDDLLEYRMTYASSTWSAWTKTFNSDGSVALAASATSATSASGLAALYSIGGSYTGGAMYTAITGVFGTGTWAHSFAGLAACVSNSSVTASVVGCLNQNCGKIWCAGTGHVFFNGTYYNSVPLAMDIKQGQWDSGNGSAASSYFSVYA